MLKELSKSIILYMQIEYNRYRATDDWSVEHNSSVHFIVEPCTERNIIISLAFFNHILLFSRAKHVVD